jgi:ATP-dependent DNA ligase
MGLEAIVSKRLGSRYVSGRTRAWLKKKNSLDDFYSPPKTIEQVRRLVVQSRHLMEWVEFESVWL